MASAVTLHLVAAPPDRPASAELIFVHGLGGDVVDTWCPPGEPELYWPRWIADELPNFRVRTVGYPAAPTHWRLDASDMGIIDRAKNILEYLSLNDVGALPTFFVGYSLGGLIVKQMLCSAATLGVEKWRPILEQTRGVVFLATPHTGSSLSQVATLLAPLSRPTAATRDLAAESEFLRQLTDWFRQNADRLGIAVEAYCEREKTRGVYVVDPSSANPGVFGCVPVAVDADHISISKPRDRSDLVVRGVSAFLRRRAGAHVSPVTPNPPPAGPAHFALVFRDQAARDCEAAELPAAQVEEFFEREFKDHPNIFLVEFVSRPFAFRYYTLFASFDGETVAIERIAEQRHHPLVNRWSELLAQYKTAHALPYRRSGAPPPQGFKRELRHYKRMVAGISEYLCEYHESFGLCQDCHAIESLMQEAEIFSMDNPAQTISALESILSNVHKLLLSTIPHAPLLNAEGRERLADQMRRERSAGTKVLVMEDEDLVRPLIEDIVAEYAPGWTILSCKTTTEAFAYLVNDDVDIFISDINMDGLPGQEVVRSFHKASPGTQIIVATGYGPLEELDGQVLAQLRKPFGAPELNALFDTIVSQQPELLADRGSPVA